MTRIIVSVRRGPVVVANQPAEFIDRQHPLVGLAGVGLWGRQPYPPGGVPCEIAPLHRGLPQAPKRRDDPAHHPPTGATAQQVGQRRLADGGLVTRATSGERARRARARKSSRVGKAMPSVARCGWHPGHDVCPPQPRS
jgi:hypothetical protein